MLKKTHWSCKKKIMPIYISLYFTIYFLQPLLDLWRNYKTYLYIHYPFNEQCTVLQLSTSVFINLGKTCYSCHLYTFKIISCIGQAYGFLDIVHIKKSLSMHSSYLAFSQFMSFFSSLLCALIFLVSFQLSIWFEDKIDK